ncbi:S1C family serine protease [Acidisphaera sp. L21]|uniref:S1C family serine protease n=1 Tax=Acidisphaera sp. L21 TaxID=1641851 RepID=UPI00131B8C10|nr:serine protease [Acidisphaera sp. L21]
MRDQVDVCARLGLLLGVLALAPAAKQPPLAAGAPVSAVPKGKPPPLQPGEAVIPPHPDSTGTSFVAAEGRLLTNRHVVDGCRRMVARNARGTEETARVLASDPQRDLALLSVTPAFGPPLTFRTMPEVKLGETVITFGFPLAGLLSAGPTLTTGAISALSGLRDNQTNFQISAPVQPGNSGGPLFDAQGNVIGIVVAKLNAARVAEMTDGDIPQNVNFAVKGGPLMDFLWEQGVTPRTATSAGPDRGAPAVGDIANPSTAFLQCFH